MAFHPLESLRGNVEQRLADLAGMVSKRAVQMYEAIGWFEERASSLRARRNRSARIAAPDTIREVPEPGVRSAVLKEKPLPPPPPRLHGRRAMATASPRKVTAAEGGKKRPPNAKLPRGPKPGPKVKRGQKHRHQH